MRNKTIFAFFLLILLLFLNGCGAKYIHKSFKSEDIDRITVLPFMDNRENPDPELNFEKLAQFGQSSIIDSLKYKKKYRTVVSGDIGNVSSYSVQDLPSRDLNSNTAFSVDPESVDSGWIKQLGPSMERWILVPVLEDVSSTNVLIQMLASAKISAYLFNKKTGELWWQCSGTGRFAVGILTYGIMKANSPEENLLEEGVLSTAGAQCIENLPVRSGPYLLPD